MRRKSNRSKKSNRTRKNTYKRVKISKQKTRRNKSSHRGGGLGNYLWKGFNVFKKDPLQIRSKGREADALYLLNLFSDDQWRQVKRNILALATIDLNPSIMGSKLAMEAEKVLKLRD